MYEDRPPILINPGGVVDPRSIVGRDDDLTQVIRALERGGGVVLSGERRHGKTSFSRLVEARVRERGWTVITRSVEGMDTMESISDALATDLVGALPRMERIKTWLRSRAEIEVAGVSVGSAPVTLEDILGEACDCAQRLLLILDELPICARALERAQPGAGLACLHTLRRIRQENPTLTMLCLGSIGFHHVLPNLEGALNDIDKHPLQPLSADHAHELAARLLSSTSISREARGYLAPAMAAASEGVPYYLHHLADDCQRRHVQGQSLDARLIAVGVAEAIASRDDPWDLKHYVSRLTGYYRHDAPAAAAILDLLAVQPSTLASIRTGLGTSSGEIASADLSGIVGRLEQDHYLTKVEGQFEFRSDIVRRAWLRWRT